MKMTLSTRLRMAASTTGAMVVTVQRRAEREQHRASEEVKQSKAKQADNGH